MRILHWLDLWWREVGGPIRSISDLSAAMEERGHEVVLATADPRDAPAEWLRGPNPRMHVLRHGILGRIAAAESDRLRRIVAGVDVVHLHGLWERSTHSIAREARRAGKPVVLSTRGVLDDWAMTQRVVRKRLFLACIGRHTLDRAAVVHCTSLGEARQVEARIGRVPTVIPNLLRIEPLLALQRSESTTPSILFLGRLHESKGLDILLRAVASISTTGLAPHVDVAGAGSPEELRQAKALTETLGISRRVRFLGHLDDKTRGEALSRAWMMALPTAQENFGNAIFESLAAGVPVLVSKGLDAETELGASGGAELVDRTVDGVRAGLVSMLSNPRRRSDMGDSARRWCERELRPRVVGARFEAMYETARSIS